MHEVTHRLDGVLAFEHFVPDVPVAAGWWSCVGIRLMHDVLHRLDGALAFEHFGPDAPLVIVLGSTVAGLALCISLCSSCAGFLVAWFSPSSGSHLQCFC